MSAVAKRLDRSGCHLVRRSASAQLAPVYTMLDGAMLPTKVAWHPTFRPMSIVANGRPSQLLLSSWNFYFARYS